MDKDLAAILYPSAQIPSQFHLNSRTDSATATQSFRNSTRRKVVIGACVASTALLGGILIPFVSPGFRRISLPFLPATTHQVETITNILRARPPGAGSTLIDLGSGDGRLVIAAAKEGLKATGVELNWWLILWSRWRSFRLGTSSKTTFIRQDLYKTNLSRYDVVVLFGVSGMMEKMELKLREELKDGGLFLACRFPLPSSRVNRVFGAGVDTVWLYNKSDIAR